MSPVLRRLTTKPLFWWIAIPSVLLLLWAFLVADFQTSIVLRELHSAARSSVRRAPTGAEVVPARIQEIVVEVEGQDWLSIGMDLALSEELRKHTDFTDVRPPDLSGGRAFPLLRVRCKPSGVWLALFASGTLVVEYSYVTFESMVEPAADAAWVEFPEKPVQNGAVLTNRIEHEVSAFGPISLPAWEDERVETVAQAIVEEVLNVQRQVRGLK
jgi:hypothetical protein